jgi:hypothetical protein
VDLRHARLLGYAALKSVQNALDRLIQPGRRGDLLQPRPDDPRDILLHRRLGDGGGDEHLAVNAVFHMG